jgi:transcriptional repressor NrdR
MCEKCSQRFTTYERVELINLLVVKRDSQRESYDRIKLIRGITKACEKRPISMQQIEDMVSKIEQEVESKYNKEVNSKKLGELVMRELKKTDKVAYIRFASVYRKFKDLDEFRKELKKLTD